MSRKYRIWILFKIASVLTMLSLLLNLLLPATRHSSSYRDHGTHVSILNILPHPPNVQRKLSHVSNRSTAAKSRHDYVHVYNFSKQIPTEVSFDCVLTKTVPDFRICIYSSLEDKFISKSLRSSGIWEPYITIMFQRALDTFPDSIVIDVGANSGYYSFLAAKMGHAVIAVEPVYDNVLRFHQGVLLNKLTDKVLLSYNAISDQILNITMTTNKDNQGGLWIKKVVTSEDISTPLRRLATDIVQTITMDHLVTLTDFHQAIIKLDIEGFECKALAGASQLLTAVYVPYIFMEWRKMFTTRLIPQSPCPAAAMMRLAVMLTRRGYIPYEVRTGFQLDPARCNTRWQLGDLYWRHELAKPLQVPY